MNARSNLLRPPCVLLFALIVVAGPLAACSADGEPAPSATRSGVVGPSATGTPAGVRFVIDCAGVDDSAIGPFTRLEEAWASTNYLLIEGCEARLASADVELTDSEKAVAQDAGAGAPDETELFLEVLAVCVRVQRSAMAALAEDLLLAALELCPEAPHAGLMMAEIEARGDG